MKELHFHAGDGCPLIGSLALPQRMPAPLVVAAHGSSTGTREAFLHQHLAEFLPSAGVGTFVFDRRGEGASGGEPDASLSLLASDVASAVAAAADQGEVDANHIGLWGHSQGGWIAPLAAVQTATVRFMIVVSGSGVSPADQMRFAIRNILGEAGYGHAVIERALSLRDRAVARWSGAADDRLSADLAAVRHKPWYAMAYLPEPEERGHYSFEFDFDIRPTLRRLRLPTLLIYGQTDRWVPIDESIATWQNSYGSPESLTVEQLPGAGHFPTLAIDPQDLDEKGPLSPDYERVLAGWLSDQVAAA